MDDPLTLVHLFAALPASDRLKIEVKRVHNCRKLVSHTCHIKEETGVKEPVELVWCSENVICLINDSLFMLSISAPYILTLISAALLD